MEKIKTLGNLMDFMLESYKKTNDYTQEIKSKVTPNYNVIDVCFMLYISQEKKEHHYDVKFLIKEEGKKELTALWYYGNDIEKKREPAIDKKFYEDNKELIMTTLNNLNSDSNFGTFLCSSAGAKNYSTTKFKIDDSNIGEITINSVILYHNAEKCFEYFYNASHKREKFDQKVVDILNETPENIINVLRDTPIEITKPSIILQKATSNEIIDIIDNTEQTYDNTSNKRK